MVAQLAGLGGLALLGGAPAASGRLASLLGGNDRTTAILLPVNGDYHVVDVDGGALHYVVLVGIEDDSLKECIRDAEEELLAAFDEVLVAFGIDGWPTAEHLDQVEWAFLSEVQQRCPASTDGDDDDSASPGYRWLLIDTEWRPDEMHFTGIIQRPQGCRCSTAPAKRRIYQPSPSIAGDSSR